MSTASCSIRTSTSSRTPVTENCRMSTITSSLDDGDLGQRCEPVGQRMDEFYRLTRQRLPDAVLVGGVLEAGGFASLNGVQLEGWPNRNIGSSTPDYREIDGRLSSYSVQMHHRQYGPRYTEGFNRVTTKLYPYGAPGSNNATVQVRVRPDASRRRLLRPAELGHDGPLVGRVRGGRGARVGDLWSCHCLEPEQRVPDPQAHRLDGMAARAALPRLQ